MLATKKQVGADGKGAARRSPAKFFCAALIPIFGTVSACGGETGRSRTDLDLEAMGRVTLPLQNVYGFEVTVNEAKISVDKIAFFEGAPLFSFLRTWRSMFIATAYAHPGHYEPGEALADVSGPMVLDLLGPPLVASGNGVTGSYRSVELTLKPSPELGGATVRILGTARRDGISRSFRANLSLDEAIEGIAGGFEIERSLARVRFIVELERWVERIDFSQIASGTEELEVNTQPYNAFLRGVRNTSAYRFEVKESVQ